MGSSIVTILLTLTALIAFPIFTMGIICKYKDSLTTEQFLKVYGTFTEGLRPHKNMALIYNGYFILRRLLIVLILLFLMDHPQFQPLCMLALSFVNQLIIIKFKPYQSRVDHYIELYNEVSVMLCALAYFCMTDYSDEYVMKQQAGWALVGLTLLSFAVNGMYAIVMMLLDLCKRCVERCRRAKKYSEVYVLDTQQQDAK